MAMINDRNVKSSNTKWAYFQGSLYFLTLEKRTWKTAQEICAQNRSRLVEIETEQEHDFIVNNIYEPNSPNGGFVWLGATYNKSESKFVWSSTGLPLGFSFWRAGEPKATTDVTDCVHVHVKEKGIWDTTPCGYSFSYLCELKIT
ncbi:C-type lectin domain family 4 member D-like isoform X2 [Ostrea edulis]|uniref:C-type lectin domain family 4 member D-like isoform X2 n=1 Tax=Ostrea edulis TaxID=37623 RepID=UPI002095EDF1|nr:C-type lectin domain family 4 member D-like isoform X2 [Ostrea edulis]